MNASVEKRLREKPGTAPFKKWLGVVALLVVAVAVPFVASPARVFNLSYAFVLGCAVVGMVLLTGYTKQISLGQNFFVAVGAYLAVWAINDLNIPFYVAPLFGFVICYVIGYSFGLLVPGINGTYLALVTMGMGLVTPHLIRKFEWFTGGSMGQHIKRIKPHENIPLTNDQWLYFICLIGFLFIVMLAKWIERGHVGRAMKAVGDNGTAVSALGVNLRMAKSMAFAWSGAFAGFSGGLFVILIGYIAPGSVDVFLSIHLLAALVIGGQNRILGALVGAIFVVFVPFQLQTISDSFSGALFGVLIIVTMLLFREGIVGGVIWLIEHLRKRKQPKNAF